MTKLTVIDDPTRTDELTSYLADKDIIALDCETTGVHKGAEIIGISVCADESEAFYVILAQWNVETKALVYLDTKDSVAALLSSLKGKNIIAHNGVFDCAMIESYFKIRLIDSLFCDTMILAHLLDENRRVGLKELGTSIFGDDAATEAKLMKESVAANGGELTKANFEMYKADSQLLAKYGAKDALLTYRLFLHLLPDLYEQNLNKFFFEDESMPLLRGPTYELNTVGLRVDQNALQTLKKTLEAECLEAKDFIYSEIAAHIKDRYPGTSKKNSFNIGSSSQMAWLLFGLLGLEFNSLTKGGKDIAKHLGLKVYTAAQKRDFISTVENHKGATYQEQVKSYESPKKPKKIRDPWNYIQADKEALKKHAQKYKWIGALLDYARKKKILNTYVEGIEERTTYGIIQPSFLQHGTTSGRYSSRNPNFQNLPRDDKRVKACIVARTGKVFVGADYSQLEPRVFAYFSGDSRLLAAFKGTDDFYSVIGMEVYGKYDCTPQKEGSPDAFGVKYKKLRDLSKVIALASTYGSTAHRLARTTGKSVEDTQEDIDAYFERFPGVAQMMLTSHALAKKDGFVTNLFGRMRRMPEAKRINKLYGDLDHGDLPYEARNILNLSVNHRIQSTAASIVNRAAIAFHLNCQKVGINCQIVVQVHDSLVIECDAQDAENVSLLLQDAMQETVKLSGIELEAIPKIGINLSEV